MAKTDETYESVEQTPEPEPTPEETAEFYDGPSQEQLEAPPLSDPYIAPELLAAARGEAVDMTEHPIDQGGDSAENWYLEHPEDRPVEDND